MSKKEGRVSVQLRISMSLHQHLTVLAAQKGFSLNGLAELLLRSGIRAEGFEIAPAPPGCYTPLDNSLGAFIVPSLAKQD